MATKQITTWDEFKTALTETITENTTYEIMNDIDVSDTLITSTISVACAYNKTFQPPEGTDNVKINGITSYANLSYNGIIKYNSGGKHKCTFNNIHFSNFNILQTCLFGNPSSANSDGYGIICNNCLFNGVCYALHRGDTSYSLISYYYCSVNIKANKIEYAASVNDTPRSIMHDCYIIFNPLSDTAVDSGGHWRAIDFRDCYIGGKIKINYNTSNYLFGNYYMNEQRIVFNVDVTIANYSSSTTYYITGKNLTMANASIFNKSKIYQSDGVTPAANVAGKTNWYALTDEQMKNKTYIQENTNFPLEG